MIYTTEQIAHAKRQIRPETLAYIQELETRLHLIETSSNDFLRAMGLPAPIESTDDAVLAQTKTSEQENTHNINSADGTNKAGECVQLRIDPENIPANKVLWESMGYFITLSTQTPEEARALFAALLTIEEVDTD